MPSQIDFTSGSVSRTLIHFALPVMFALFLQAMYGTVDLLIVGQFASSTDVSAVATGSQIMQTVTNLISSLATGTTVLLGQKIGEKKPSEGGEIAGASLVLFALIGIAFSLLLTLGAAPLSRAMNAPEAAFLKTVHYLSICGGGTLIIIFYNLIGGLFRGMGDSHTPFIAAAIACVSNVVLDLLMVAVFSFGAAGAALATVLSQCISVLLSYQFIRQKKLPFTLTLAHIRFQKKTIKRILILGVPLAVQDFFVGLSFLIILAIANSLGVDASAGVGVSEKICGFIMLVSASFMQSMAAFTAQNKGAGRMDRAVKALHCAMGLSCGCGLIMGFFTFFHGDILAGLFTSSPSVMAAAADCLKAYAFDAFLTSFLFCFIGFYNGLGLTTFVMVQGIFGSFGVRVPLSYLMSQFQPVSLFHIGLATPVSTLIQIALCLGCWSFLKKHPSHLQ
ncbi:MATE family efflux transporter [Acidaminococcus sp.]|uniref:MATE family efflux transporter n=1 Tax=Acidaminococcus sp. TaxID=1872103 RepID=UPI003AB66CD5